MKIEVEVRVKVTEKGEARTVTYSQREEVEVGDNFRFVQTEARKIIDHVEELALAAVAVQYVPLNTEKGTA